MRSEGTAQPWLLIFTTTWSPQSQGMKARFDELSMKLKGEVSVGLVDADAEPELADRFNVLTFPTLIIVHKVLCHILCL